MSNRTRSSAKAPGGSVAVKGTKTRRKSTARANVTRDEIIATALTIVDEGGLSALTMRELSERLGVYPNTVYWHLGSRSSLVGAVSTMVFDEIRLPDQRDVTWQ